MAKRATAAPQRRATPPAAAGYSATPLARKLGLASGHRLAAIDAPDGYAGWLEPLPPGVVLGTDAGPRTDVVHLFVTRDDVLARTLTALRAALRPDAVLWVSWPKKAARVATTVTEDTIRASALPLGFVDVKVCAVTDVWSGLKLVVRRELR